MSACMVASVCDGIGSQAPISTQLLFSRMASRYQTARVGWRVGEESAMFKNHVDASGSKKHAWGVPSMHLANCHLGPERIILLELLGPVHSMARDHQHHVEHVEYHEPCVDQSCMDEACIDGRGLDAPAPPRNRGHGTNQHPLRVRTS